MRVRTQGALLLAVLGAGCIDKTRWAAPEEVADAGEAPRPAPDVEVEPAPPAEVPEPAPPPEPSRALGLATRIRYGGPLVVVRPGADGGLTTRQIGPAPGFPGGVCFVSVGGAFLALHGGTALRLDTETGAWERLPVGAELRCIAPAPLKVEGAAAFVAGSRDRSVVRVDLEPLRVRRLASPPAWYASEMRADGRRLVWLAEPEEEGIPLWQQRLDGPDPGEPEQVTVLPADAERLRALVGERLLVRRGYPHGDGGDTYVVDLAEGARAELRLGGAAVLYGPRGRWLTTGAQDRELYDDLPGEPARLWGIGLPGLPAFVRVRGVRPRLFRGEGRWLLASAEGRGVLRYDVSGDAPGEPVVLLGGIGRVWDLVPVPGGRLWVTGDAGGWVLPLEPEPGRTALRRLPALPWTRVLGVTPDGAAVWLAGEAEETWYPAGGPSWTRYATLQRLALDGSTPVLAEVPLAHYLEQRAWVRPADGALVLQTAGSESRRIVRARPDGATEVLAEVAPSPSPDQMGNTTGRTQLVFGGAVAVTQVETLGPLVAVDLAAPEPLPPVPVATRDIPPPACTGREHYYDFVLLTPDAARVVYWTLDGREWSLRSARTDGSEHPEGRELLRQPYWHESFAGDLVLDDRWVVAWDGEALRVVAVDGAGAEATGVLPLRAARVRGGTPFLPDGRLLLSRPCPEPYGVCGWEVATIEPDGSVHTTPGAELDESGGRLDEVRLPDGRLVFSRASLDVEGTRTLFVLDVTGPDAVPRRISPAIPVPSPSALEVLPLPGERLAWWIEDYHRGSDPLRVSVVRLDGADRDDPTRVRLPVAGAWEGDEPAAFRPDPHLWLAGGPAGGEWDVWRLDPRGGPPLRLTPEDTSSESPAGISPDRRLLAHGARPGPWRVVRGTPLGGGEARTLLELPGYGVEPVGWTR